MGSDHHFCQGFDNHLVGIASKIFLFLAFDYILQIRELHNFSPEQGLPDLSEDIQNGIIENDVIIFDLEEVADKFIDLLFAYFQPMV